MKKLADLKFSEIYPLYLKKVTKKNRSEDELLQIISWLTNYSFDQIKELSESEVTFAEFFDGCQLNPDASKIMGVICGVRVEEIQDPLTQKIRYLDKVVDELAKNKSIEKIMRS